MSNIIIITMIAKSEKLKWQGLYRYAEIMKMINSEYNDMIIIRMIRMVKAIPL